MKVRQWKKRVRGMIATVMTLGIMVGSCVTTYALPTKSTVQQPDKVSTNHHFYGIDVSVWQGNINWKKVKHAGADYTFVRAGATSQDSFTLIKDRTYEKNMKEAASAGVARGVYWYSQATTTEEAVAEAKETCKYAKGKNLELPIVMDMEFSNGRLDAAYAEWVAEGGTSNAREQLTKIADAFLNYCRKQGYTTCLYVSKSLTSKTSGVDVSKLVKDGHELWIAQYNEDNTSSEDYTYWQYSSIDQIDGIKSRIDSNYMYIPKDKKVVGSKRIDAMMEYKQLACTGNPVEPQVTVKDGVTELTKNKDYTLIYLDNIKKGTAFALVKGKGKYLGYTECIPFRIGDKTVEKEVKEDSVTDVVTSESDGKTRVKFTAAESGAGNYRIYYRDSDQEEWKHVDTNKTDVIIEGTPSKVKVATVQDNKVVATTTPKNNKKTSIIDKTVKADTKVCGPKQEIQDRVRLIDKEVSRDVTTGSRTN